MNTVILIGRLCADPELKYLQSGTAACNFTLAVDRQFTNQAGEKETDFIPIITWQKLAESCANHLNKGRLVAVDGRLQIRSYETQDGQKRRVAEVVAGSVQFLDWGKKEKTSQAAPEQKEDLSEINLDDLPF